MIPAIAVQKQFSRFSIAFRSGMAALCRAWTARTLNSAIADVTSMSDQEFSDFGFDKGDILRGLRQLRYDLECSNLRLVARSHRNDHQEPADNKLFSANTRELLVITRLSCGL
jgi:hypothetical protein